MSEYMAQYKKVAEQFALKGEVTDICPYGEGHINLTLLVTTTEKRYIMQKMNTRVFTDPDSLMANICGVTEHLQSRGIETLNVVPTKAGDSFLKAEECYRVYDFIEDTVTYQTVTDKEVFKNSGRAFGEFQNYLAEFDASKLTETIKRFHDTPNRFAAFKEALAADKFGRAKDCQEEINFVLSHENTYGIAMQGLKDGSLPLRVTHNDTKLNNVLMDKENNAVCVVDLDTVMPGSALYDFGDSIRFGASTALEDEEDLSKVQLDLELFEAFADGYLETAGPAMTTKEIEWLPFAAKMMTLECGIRFLTDYLNGDTYFKIAHAEHNLVRARTQFKLVQEDEDKMEEMQAIIRALVHKYTGK